MKTGRGSKDRPSAGFNRPFQRLQDQVRLPAGEGRDKPVPPRVPADLDEAALFQDAMREVVPLASRGAFSVPWRPRPCPPRPRLQEDWEALCQLTDLVAGRGPFDLSLTDEYVEGQVPHLDPQVMAALKAGALPIQDHCDLHGLSVALAQVRLRDFLAQAQVCGAGWT